MPARAVGRAERDLVNELVSHYIDNESKIRRFLISFYDPIVDAMTENEPLFGLVHSIKYRMKDPIHLKEKLLRKLSDLRNRKQPFPYNNDQPI